MEGIISYYRVSTQKQGNTPRTELRNFGIGAQILRALGLSRIRLLTNNPRKIVGLEAYNLEITERVPLEISENTNNRDYLRRKREQEGHLIGP